MPLPASETLHFERVSRLKGRLKKIIEKGAIFPQRYSPDLNPAASQNYLQRYPIISSSGNILGAFTLGHRVKR